MDNLLKELETLSYIPWTKIQNFVDKANELSVSLDQWHSLFVALQAKFEQQQEQFRIILEQRAQNYDILVSRLQLMESQPNDSSEHEEEDENSELVGMSLEKLLHEEEEDYVTLATDYEDHAKIETMKSRLQISRGTSVQCWSADTADPTEQKSLAEMNKKYLALGLTWKKKYESAQRTIKTMTEEHLREVQNLYSLLSKMPTTKAQPQIKI